MCSTIMNHKPSIVIVSCSSIKPKSLIKLITGCKDTEIIEEEPEKVSYQWKIDTKYYTADVDIFGITEAYQRTTDFNNSVEALIVHVDTNKESGLNDLKKWNSIECDCEPDVKLLISNYCSNETKITKAKAIEWCLKKGFELVELYPKITNTKEEDDIMPEKFGVDRIIEALHTHVWPNLIMKGKESLKSDGVPAANGLQDILGGDGEDDFTELFQQMHMMKESIQSMPSKQRKQYAEQIVTAFWKAIGGDEEEISDL